MKVACLEELKARAKEAFEHIIPKTIDRFWKELDSRTDICRTTSAHTHTHTHTHTKVCHRNKTLTANHLLCVIEFSFTLLHLVQIVFFLISSLFVHPILLYGMEEITLTL
jgi:hypothetical protein